MAFTWIGVGVSIPMRASARTVRGVAPSWAKAERVVDASVREAGIGRRVALEIWAGAA